MQLLFLQSLLFQQHSCLVQLSAQSQGKSIPEARCGSFTLHLLLRARPDRVILSLRQLVEELLSPPNRRLGSRLHFELHLLLLDAHRHLPVPPVLLLPSSSQHAAPPAHRLPFHLHPLHRQQLLAQPCSVCPSSCCRSVANSVENENHQGTRYMDQPRLASPAQIVPRPHDQRKPLSPGLFLFVFSWTCPEASFARLQLDYL
mmetsp:Transcript_23119/g.75231  ORF Transcript_23119/g.75231 Transcript_23119/m.75231 type:complete len:202 (+) Transcript_23119:1689-2294(+)